MNLAETLSRPDSQSAESNYGRWVKFGLENGFTQFLSASDGFRCLNGSEHPWRGQTPGIYFWLAGNGEAYVGQSIVPRSRLKQHMKVHGDLVHAAFQPCKRAELDGLERHLVDLAGKQFQLRNIKFALSTVSNVPFDELVTPAEQQAFLAGEALARSEWRSLDEHRRRQNRKFERFLDIPSSKDALTCVARFVKLALPGAPDTEVVFWSASLLSERNLVRINVGQQEVFTFDWRTNRVRIMSDRSLSLLHSWRTDYETPSWVNNLRPSQLETFLTGRRLLSVRRLVLRLMRHTQTLNSASHCPQLVRVPTEAPLPSLR